MPPIDDNEVHFDPYTAESLPTDETITLSELTGFTAKQQEASDAVNAYKYVLYGGAMAGGKSYFIRWKLLTMLVHWHHVTGLRQIEVGLFCENYPTLKDRQLSKISGEFPEWIGALHDDHKAHGKCFILHPEYGGGIIKFRNLDDPSKYRSAEFAAIAVDELTMNPKETFLDLKHRLRWPGIEDVRFFAGTNPGGIGHAWVKKLWMDRDFEPEEQEESKEYFYVPALASDNPHIAHSYLKQLDTLPDEMARAFRDGDWDIFKGQFFGEWRRSRHVVDPFPVPPEWKRYLCGDYGYSAPSAVYWCAVSPDDIIYVYRELYMTSLTYEMLAREIIARTPDDETIAFWVFDPAIWAKSGASATAMSGADIIEQTYTRTMRVATDMRKRYLRLMKGDNNRVIGWGMFRERLKPRLCGDGEIRAGIQVFSTCHNLIREIPALVFDKNNVEDCDSSGSDHGPDACLGGDTMVLTERGECKIKHILPGDIVYTRRGLRRVLASGMTSESAKVYDVMLSSGRSLRGTGNHPVWVAGKGFVPLDTLRYGDTLLSCDRWLFQRQFKSLMESGTISAASTLGETEQSCTVESGSTTSEALDPDFTSTTKTETGRTTLSKISSDCLCSSICLGTAGRKKPANDHDARCHCMHSTKHVSGTDLMKEEGGTQNMGSIYGKSVCRSAEHVNSVDLCMKQKHCITPLDFAPINANLDTVAQVELMTNCVTVHDVVSSSDQISMTNSNTAPVCVLAIREVGNQPTYNLSVDGDEEYFAQGILVHNCRYGLMANPQRTRTKEEVDDMAFRKKIKENRRRASLAWSTRR